MSHMKHMSFEGNSNPYFPTINSIMRNTHLRVYSAKNYNTSQNIFKEQISTNTLKNFVKTKTQI